MSTYQARIVLGILMRQIREDEMQWSRSKVSHHSGVRRKAIVKLEHGSPRQERREIIGLIEYYPLPLEKKYTLVSLLNASFPEDKSQMFRLPSHLLSVMRKHNRNSPHITRELSPKRHPHRHFSSVSLFR